MNRRSSIVSAFAVASLLTASTVAAQDLVVFTGTVSAVSDGRSKSPTRLSEAPANGVAYLKGSSSRPARSSSTVKGKRRAGSQLRRCGVPRCRRHDL